MTTEMTRILTYIVGSATIAAASKWPQYSTIFTPLGAAIIGWATPHIADMADKVSLSALLNKVR